MLPARADRRTNKLVDSARSKRCEACAYLHPTRGRRPGTGPLRALQTPLLPITEKLFRLQNVSTKRRDRINSDEEERQRLGFEIRTGDPLREHRGKASARSARGGGPSGDDDRRSSNTGAPPTIWRDQRRLATASQPGQAWLRARHRARLLGRRTSDPTTSTMR